MTIQEALQTYAILAVKCLLLDHEIGSIEVGKRADVVVWSQDPYRTLKTSPKCLGVETTIVNGRVVYERIEQGGLT